MPWGARGEQSPALGAGEKGVPGAGGQGVDMETAAAACRPHHKPPARAMQRTNQRRMEWLHRPFRLQILAEVIPHVLLLPILSAGRRAQLSTESSTATMHRDMMCREVI